MWMLQPRLLHSSSTSHTENLEHVDKVKIRLKMNKITMKMKQSLIQSIMLISK